MAQIGDGSALVRLRAYGGGNFSPTKLAYYPAGIDLVGDVALEIARQIRNQYTIAFAPTNQALDRTYRAMRVTVAGPEALSVRTRAGYRATKS